MTLALGPSDPMVGFVPPTRTHEPGKVVVLNNLVRRVPCHAVPSHALVLQYSPVC